MGKVLCQVNNSVTFSEKAIETEEFLNRMAETLGIIIDRCPKERIHRMESQTIEKIGCAHFLNENFLLFFLKKEGFLIKM